MTSDGKSRLSILFGAAIACLLAALIPQYLAAQSRPDESPVDPSLPKFDATNQLAACVALAAALPESVYSSHHPAFQATTTSYWSLNACEKKPACVVQPANKQEVAAAVKVLKSESDAAERSDMLPVRFAVKSGGHSPEASFASIDGGVLVDMSLLKDVKVSQNHQSVEIGVGARWLDVYSELDGMGLAMVGGRNSNVGVGGLVLGGGVSFFSPRYGMVCDNIEKYEIVLANGTIAQVTSSQHADLWRALKGGTGNFGIVTRVTAKTFVAGKIWAGYTFWTSWQAPQILKAFADFNRPENFDEYASGPILVLAYIQAVGLKLTISNLAYTKPEKWPPVFKAFNSLWRIWSTSKIQPLSDATQELHRLAPSGQRQFQVTTTIRNDLGTFLEFRKIFDGKLEEVRSIKGSVWSLVFQPLSPATVTNSSSSDSFPDPPNILGLSSTLSTTRGEPLIIVLVTVAWQLAADDGVVHRISREIIDLCEEYAERKGTAEKFRYLNYAASGQDPLGSYGTENQRFMREVSARYDPEGLFQRGRAGGFRLEMEKGG